MCDKFKTRSSALTARLGPLLVLLTVGLVLVVQILIPAITPG